MIVFPIVKSLQSDGSKMRSCENIHIRKIKDLKSQPVPPGSIRFKGVKIIIEIIV